MNKFFNKNHLHVALVLLLSSPLSLPVSADQHLAQPATNLSGTVKPVAINGQALVDKKQQIVSEAAESVAETQKALEAIEKDDPKKAQALLQGVLGKLDVILAKYPNIALVSADIDTDIIEFAGDANDAKKAIDAANDFMDDGKIQEARQILAELRSEARITTTAIPLKTYPFAIKEAVRLLSTNNANKAATTLYDVLNTLVESTEVIPLPVLNAEILLTEASEVEHKQDLSKAQSRSEVMKLTEAAKGQLEFARLLGYGDKNDYKLLYTAIDEIEDTIDSEKSAATWSAIKQHLSLLKNKLTFFEK